MFAGGFDLEAAEAICTTPDVDALDVLDLLGSLVDKSLVVADHSPEAVRYRLLETIRQYSAQELLRAAGDAEVLSIRDRHARYYLDLAKAGGPATTRHGQGQWLRRFDTEWDNLRAAFAHFAAAEDRGEEILALAVSLRRFSLSRGHHGGARLPPARHRQAGGRAKRPAGGRDDGRGAADRPPVQDGPRRARRREGVRRARAWPWHAQSATGTPRLRRSATSSSPPTSPATWRPDTG